LKRNTKLQLKKKWIYIEIGQDTDTKYGEISLDHLNLINDNENSEKIIMISNARYIDELDSIVKKVSEYDEHKSGTFYYKIKTIDYLEVLKKDPFETKVEINE
tara:strand:+ start:278 stop:586 length:309 start_codon:yes stop_codon:yes gene_type:complete